MPYTDKEKQREAKKRYYEANKDKEFARVRRFRNKSSVTEPVTEPKNRVTEPVSVPKKTVIESLREKMAAIKPEVKPFVPQVMERPAYAPKIKMQNYSESTKYEYAEF